MAEVNVEINVKEIKERFRNIQLTTNSTIMPVIKNNANGVGFDNAIKIYRELKCPILATSYAKEWFKYKGNDEFYKFSWIWEEDEKYTEIKNLILVCKTFNQLSFCIKNHIPFFVEFNICMNRGGFVYDDIPQLSSILNNVNNGIINVMTHCPYEDKVLLKDYKKKVNNLLQILKDHNLSIGQITVANSYCTKTDYDLHFDYCRCGELLLLPKNKDQYSPDGYNPFNIWTKIAFTGFVKKDDWVGYHMVQLSKDTNIAVLPIGYYHFEVEHIKKVLVQTHDNSFVKCDVICAMHDTMIIDISNIKTDIGAKVIVLNKELMNDNWNRCIQKTFKLNPDMVEYSII